jgi:hypothetical protein
VNPFLIEGPAVVSFSGGRTSGLMLRRILDAGMQADVHVLFANTGKERPETLDFIHQVETRWSVPIVWLERETFFETGYVAVDHALASRHGEPFEALIADRNFLPNPVMRFCTQELKIRVMKAWMLDAGYEHWTNVVGLRADEPGRVARQRAANDEGKQRWEVACPLFDAGITKADVDAFWKAQPFDLDLKPWEGNCDLCFLKGLNRKLRVIRDDPALADWWRERERDLLGVSKPSAARFRNDQPSYEKMVEMVRTQPLLPFADDDLGPDDQSLDCFCTG